jgi:cytochrome c oxidase cbb3-type subunit 3
VSFGASLWVVIATLLNVVGVLWLLWWTAKRRGPANAEAETTGHVWDDDLTELNRPLPRWWLGLFLITVVFGLVYLALYPGLGNFKGTRGWSEIDQYREQSRQVEAQLARTLAPFASAPIADLEHNADALRIGRNLFLNNCAGCHGSDARGAPGFPNLTDHDWLYGGAEADVLQTIQMGRGGVMPAWKSTLGSQGTEDVLAYVLSLSGRAVPAGDPATGKQKFEQICSACHGADGHGNPQIGAPNLTDSIWLYGGSVAVVRETISSGHQGQMPAHLERLGETRTKLLAAYVLSLNTSAKGAVGK